MVCSQSAAQATPPFVVKSSEVFSIPGTSIDSYTGRRAPAQLKTGRALYSEGAFIPVDTETPDFGVTDAGIWLKFSLLIDGEANGNWVLDTGVPFLRTISVWAVSANKVQSVLSDGRTTHFNDRQQQQRMLVSQEFALVPGTVTDIWIYFESDSTSALPMRVYPAEDVDKAALQSDIPLIVFYTVAILFFVFVVAFAFVLSSKVAFYYAGFFGCVLAYNAQLTGTLFVYLWPEFPNWNAVASHPFGMGAIVFALLMGREFIKTGRQRRWLRYLVLAVTIISAIYIFAPLVMPLVVTKKFAAPIVLSFLVLQVLLAFIAFKDRMPGSVFYVLGSLTLFGYIGLFTLLTQGHLEMASTNKELMIRYGQLVDGLIFCFAVVRQTWLLRDDAHRSKEVAEASTLELATTRHDLRQPLLSLKMALQASDLGANSVASGRVTESLDYIESIILDSDPRNKTSPASISQDRFEPFELKNLFDNLRMMFDEEAGTNGIDLRIVDSSLVAVAHPVHLLRVLANLLSNAIEHSDGTRILLGVRKQGEYLSFHCMDDGKGMDASEFRHLKQKFVKSDASSGEGLGLNIVSQLCGENGWRFQLGADRRGGAHFIISNVQLDSGAGRTG